MNCKDVLSTDIIESMLKSTMGVLEGGRRRKFPIVLFYIIFFIAIASVPAFAATSLDAGDVAFVGLNSDGNDDFSFVLLKDIDSGTFVYITDEGWNDSGSFSDSNASGDGIIKWTAASNLSAGTVIHVQTSDSGTIKSVPTCNTGSISDISNQFLVSYIGDQLFIYQGTRSNPVFIAGIHYNIEAGVTTSNDWDEATSSNSTSELPNQLTNGSNAIWVYESGPTERDNFIYGGSVTSGTHSDLLNAINKLSNWNVDTSNSSPYSLFPYPHTFTITAGDFTPPSPSFTPADGDTYIALDANIEVSFDEGIRLINDNAVNNTNIDGCFSLKNSSNNVITFDATISGNIVTINPNSNFDNDEEYTVSVVANTLEDISNNTVVADSSSFTSKPVTTDLSAGDMAFVGLNSDGDDDVVLLLLKDILLGTSVYISDLGWDDSTGFIEMGGDGIIEWRSTSSMSAGSLIHIQTSDNGSIKPLPTCSTGIIKLIDGGLLVSQTGDQLFVYQGSHDTPVFITGVHYNVEPSSTANNWDGTVDTNSKSALPNQLETGTNAIWLYGNSGEEKDNFIYNGSVTTGAVSILLDAINDINNWNVDQNSDTAFTINPYPYSFAFDNIVPTISSTSPTDNADSIALDTNYQITFSETMVKGTGNISISDGTDTVTVDVSTTRVAIADNIVTINPEEDLSNDDSEYYIQIPNTAFEDTGGNAFEGILDTTTWCFTTIDLTQPTMVDKSPQDNATGILLGTDLVISFDEPVVKGSGNIIISDGTDTKTIDVSSGEVTLNGTGDIVTIDAIADLANNGANYYVQIPNTIFEDTAGNTFAGIVDTTSWNFETAINLVLDTLVNEEVEKDVSATELVATATAGDGTYNYTWYKNDTNDYTTPTDMAIRTSSFTPPSDTAGTYYYFCKITEVAGDLESINTNIMTFTVTEPLDLPALGNENVIINDSAQQLDATALDGDGLYTYDWYINNTNDYLTPTEMGISTSTYTPPTDVTGTFYYFCSVTEGAGNTETENTNIAKLEVSETALQVPVLSNESIVINDTANELDALSIAGDGSYTYTWYSNNTNDYDTPTDMSINTATYTPLSNTAGIYYYFCKVKETNGDGDIENTNVMTLTVTEDTLVIPSVLDEEVVINTTPTQLEATASSGDGSYAYQWKSADDSSGTNPISIMGETNGIYIPLSNIVGSYYYFCSVEEINGNTESGDTNVMTLIVTETALVLPTLGDEEIVKDESATELNATATDGDGEYSYEWYSNNTDDYVTPTELNITTSAFTPPSDISGTYYYFCKVIETNGDSDIENTNVMTHIVTEPLVLSTLVDEGVSRGVSATELSAGPLSGDGIYTYQWKSAENVSGTSPEAIVGETNATYTPASDTIGTYFYFCTVTETNGNNDIEDTNIMTLTITIGLDIPVLSDQTVPRNDSATRLNAEPVEGDGSYSYQWKQVDDIRKTNIQIINGATESVFTPTAILEGRYYYFCTVVEGSGDLEIKDTNIMTLTVTPDVTAPTITAIAPGDNATSIVLDTEYVITFNEPVVKGVGEITITDGTDTIVVDITTTEVAVEGRVVTVNPVVSLKNYRSVYNITIDDTAFDDTAGLNFQGISDDTTWDFTTKAPARKKRKSEESNASTPIINKTGEKSEVSVEIKVEVDGNKQIAKVEMSTVDSLVSEAEKVEKDGEKAVIAISMETTEKTKNIQVDIPRDAFDSIAKKTDASVKVAHPLLSLTFDNNAIDTINGDGDMGDVSIEIEKVDVSDLSEEVKEKLASTDAPVFDFNIKKGGTQISEFGVGKVKVAIPYTPSENQNPNQIVVYFLSDSGVLEQVEGQYNIETGMVIFNTDHFSKYLLGYNEIKFNDVIEMDWYYEAVSYMAAREISNGRSEDVFAPDAKITRAEFVTLLVRYFRFETDSTENYSDVEIDMWYEDYVAIGMANDILPDIYGEMFEPEKAITREEMIYILYKAIMVNGRILVDDGLELDSYEDANDIIDYALEGATYLVSRDVIHGYNNTIKPKDNSTRAEVAQMLYNMIVKINE